MGGKKYRKLTKNEQPFDVWFIVWFITSSFFCAKTSSPHQALWIVGGQKQKTETKINKSVHHEKKNK